MGHQVIYIPPSREERKLSSTTTTTAGSQGTVYCFGGLESHFAYQPINFKYDIVRNEWSTIVEWEEFHLSFNLLPLINDRYILVISQRDHVIYDIKADAWIPVTVEEGSDADYL